MSGIINDVDELRKFRGELTRIAEDLDKQLTRTETAIEEVASVWKDSQFQKFHSGFNEDKELIKPLREDIEAFEGDVLYPLEKKLRGYLGLL